MAKLLSILLQRNDPEYSWGFSVRGGWDQSAPLVIDQVSLGTMAAQYLAPGDTILEIDKMDARTLQQSHVDALIARPGRSLDLLILKGEGVVSPYKPTSKFTFPKSVGSPDSAVSSSSRGYESSDSGTGSLKPNRRNLRTLKDDFWGRVSNDHSQFCREGLTRLESGIQSPHTGRSSRQDEWRRCQSEERSNYRMEDKYSSVFSEKENTNYSFNPNRIQSVWSPTPSDKFRTPTSDFWSREENTSNKPWPQDTTTYEDRAEMHRSSRSGSFSKAYKRHNSDYSYGYNSLSSEYATTPKPSTNCTESPFQFADSFMKKPSDFWGENYRDQEGRLRFDNLKSPPPFSKENVVKNTNISSKSEFKKSVSIKEQSYSSSGGPKSFETYEHVNKTKETEKSSKSVDGGKEEVVEMTKKNKEYIFANKDEVDGQPKEKKKVINDFSIIEKKMDGENEYCNKTKERTEEVTDSSTPVNFYDNVQQDTGERTRKDERYANSSVKDSIIDFSDMKSEKEVKKDSSNLFSEQCDRGFNPVSGSGGYFEEPLEKNYIELDIRSPAETNVAFTSKEAILRRQSSQISGGGSPVPVSPQGDIPAAPPPPPPPSYTPAPPSSYPPAPPPPPPPGLSGSIPAVRLSTQIPDKRQSGYEPPAAIQNAMMTKDKKPFTYTPGGLDLSEIRSPRMARRINRNANTPDTAPIQPRPAFPQSNQPLPPSAVAAMQPQIAVAVLPPGGAMPHLQHVTPGGHSAPAPPPPPPQPKSHPTSPLVQNMPSPTSQPSSPQRVMNRQPSPPPVAVPKLQPQHRHTKSEPQSTPGSIYIPPIEPQQPRSQLGSLYIPPLAPQEPPTPPVTQLNKAPTPWMSRQPQQTQQVPSWVHQETVQSPPPQYQQNQGYQQPQTQQVPSWVHKETVQSPPPQYQQNQGYQKPQTRVVPIQIEGREPSQPNMRIIPIQLEGTPSPQHTPQQPNYNQQTSYQQQQQTYDQQPNQGQQTLRRMNQQPVYMHNKFNTGSQSPVPAEQSHGDNQPSWRHSQTNGTMQSPGPVQSQSFRVLQKITGTDNDGVDQGDAPYNSQGVPLSQLRKLQLSEDDRALMNKVKSQVDDETYLHNESDPRYRGSAIPSRAFRILQSMTDGTGDESDVPRGYSPVQTGQNRMAANRTPQPDAPQQYVPPSEQQVQEPRKYTGGAIPSRSFRMLQAMTAGPDSPDRPGESEY